MHQRIVSGPVRPDARLGFARRCRFCVSRSPGPTATILGSTGKPYNPTIAAASDEGEKAIRTFRVPAGLKVELFAAEPLLANPVAFCIDEKGRFYVAETFRHEAGVTDTRGHMNWLDDDLACRTVADRVAMYKKFLGKEFESYKVEHERVRRVVDTRRRRQGRQGDRLRRRLQRPGRRHRRRACWPATGEV